MLKRTWKRRQKEVEGRKGVRQNSSLPFIFSFQISLSRFSFNSPFKTKITK